MADIVLDRLFNKSKEIVTRKDAKLLGLKRYYTGLACLNGHISERQTANGSCIDCTKEKDRSEERKLKNRLSHNKHREKRIEYQRLYYIEKDKQQSISRTRIWRANNPDKLRDQLRRYAHKRRSAEGEFTTENLIQIRKLQNDKCAFCRKKLNGFGHIDHIKPISKGGSNWPRNLQWLCASCNTSKKDTDQNEYARKRGLLL